jgi:O-antigen ligase
MIAFLYTFFNFLQPGILWPELASLRPMLVISVIAGLAGLMSRGDYVKIEALKHPAFVALTAFIFAQVVSLYYGGFSSMLGEFEYWHVYLLFVAVSLYVMADIVSLRRYLLGMIFGSMVVVFYGIYAVYAHLPAAVGGRAGAYGMYENHNDYSFIIIQNLPFIYMLRREASGLLRLLLGISLLACIIGIFLSLSRGGMVALIVELILMLWASLSGRKRTWAIAAMVGFGTLAIGYQWAMRAANQGDSYTAADAESSRLELWNAGFNMVKARPILGVGSRHFNEFSREYGELSGDQIGKNSHNTYIEVVSTSGLVGFISFVLMLRAMIRELKVKVDAPGNELLDGIRAAALISLYSIILRGMLDAKPHDWSFYVLCAVTIACGMLRRTAEAEYQAENPDAVPAEGDEEVLGVAAMPTESHR